MIINGFYGKTGLQARDTTTLFIKNTAELDLMLALNDAKEIEISRIAELNGAFFVTVRLRDNLFELFKKINFTLKAPKTTVTNIAIAASITAKARVKLYKALQNILDTGGRLLYCDTDSVFAAFKKNMDNVRCGELF